MPVGVCTCQGGKQACGPRPTSSEGMRGVDWRRAFSSRGEKTGGLQMIRDEICLFEPQGELAARNGEKEKERKKEDDEKSFLPAESQNRLIDMSDSCVRPQGPRCSTRALYGPAAPTIL